MRLLAKPIMFCGHNLIIYCDGRCDLAWGIEKRPRKMLSKTDPDDFCYLGDEDPDIGAPPPLEQCGSEGGDLKPSAASLTSSDSPRMNRWCVRACERSIGIEEPRLRDLKHPQRNKDPAPHHSPSCVCVDCCAG